MKKYESRTKKKLELLSGFKALGICTTNEAIDYIFNKDVKSGVNIVKEKGWRHYVHLNKQTTKLEEEGFIFLLDEKIGELGKKEKLWSINIDNA